MTVIKTTSKSKFGSVHLRMIRAVVAFALSTANIAITQSVVAFFNLINLLNTKLASIDALRAIIALPITGIAAQKKALKNALVEFSVNIMKAVYTYAITNNDEELAASMQISRSRLNSMKYTDLVSYIQGAINKVTPIVSSLADYNITPSDITVWQSICTELDNVISNPKNAIANRESINKSIQTLYRQCMIILYRQCDQLAFQFRTTHVDYYNTYLANRKLNPFHLHTQLRAHVKDELNQPIAFATVGIAGTDIFGLTDENGYCLLEGIHFGDHSVIVNDVNFGPFTFKKGKSLTKHFTVPPVFAPAAKTTTKKETTQK